jgi:NitT/TauT family transport system substrate-binding protein
VTLASSIAFVATRAWLGSNGADLSTIRFVEMPYAAMAAAIERGTIAAASIAEPFVSQLPPGVKTLANPNDALGGRYATSLWFTTSTWLERNPALARRLTAAIYDVARWSNTHQSETAVTLATATHVDVEKARSMHRATFVTGPESQPIALSLAAAMRYGVLSRPVDLSELLAQ